MGSWDLEEEVLSPTNHQILRSSGVRACDNSNAEVADHIMVIFPSRRSSETGVVEFVMSNTDKLMPCITFTARTPIQGGSLSIRVISCSDLPNMDGMGILNRTDPYVKVICGEKMAKTEVSDAEPEHPKFNEATSTFSFPVTNPAGAEEVTFEVWDKDKLSKNDFIGRATVRLTQGLLMAADVGVLLTLPLVRPVKSDEGLEEHD